jgi:purine-nucleoside phosphorylase
MPAAQTFESAEAAIGKGSQTAIIARLSHRPPFGALIAATAPLAPRALLCADPGRALALAQDLLREPRMFNHNHGLWGYSGAATDDGKELTIQSTGIGGPSAAIVFEELIALGLGSAVYVAEATAINAGPGLVIASSVICEDGAGRALAGGERADADAGLLERLRRAAPAAAVGAVVSSDLYYDDSAWKRWVGLSALAFDMQAAALIALGAARGVPAGCLLELGTGDALAAARAAASAI